MKKYKKKNAGAPAIKIIILFFAVLTALSLKESCFKNNPLSFYLNGSPNVAQAGNSENITGWAWAETFGWVSFNSKNCDIDGDGTIEAPVPSGCQPAGTAIESYGVNINETGDFSGFAWSDNIGWVSFERIKVCDGNKSVVCTNNGQCTSQGLGSCNNINPPAAPFNSASGKIASYSASTKQITGWAYVLALGDDGWLKLSDNSVSVWNGSGARVDTVNGGELKGWGWNGNTDETVGLGWLSFNCEDPATCGTAEYHVQAPTPKGLNITSIEQYETSPCDSCSCLKINWTVDADSQQNGFNIYQNPATNPSPIASGLLPGVRTYTKTGLTAGTTYTYKVEAYNNFGQIEDTDTGATKAICSVLTNSITGTGVCPDTINLNWNIPVAGCTIDYYQVARCQCDTTCANCPDRDPGQEGDPQLTIYSLMPSGNGCYQPATDQCSDNQFTEADNYEKYRYVVRGHCSTGVYGDWSGASPKITPCPNTPKWQEKKVQ